MTIGEKIRKLRNHTGLTQRTLGALSGTSETTIKQYELGKRQPRIEQLKKIAKVFDFPLYLLLDDNFELENVELEMKRAKPVNSYEMTEPPKPFTAPLSPHNNYDGSIRVKITPESIEFDRLLHKHKAKEDFTEKERQWLIKYLEANNYKDAFEHLSRSLETIISYLEELQTAYGKLNKTGQKEAVKRVKELTEIPRYTKPDEPPKE